MSLFIKPWLQSVGVASQNAKCEATMSLFISGAQGLRPLAARSLRSRLVASRFAPGVCVASYVGGGLHDRCSA